MFDCIKLIKQVKLNNHSISVSLFLCSPTEGLVLPSDQFKGRLEFRDVSFAYPTRKEAPIFQNLSLLVPAGTIMAVVGPSGSGKSTLVSLLLRLYDTDAGKSLFCLAPRPETFNRLSIIRSVESTKLCEVLVLSFSPGIISIDGHDIRDLNPYWLRSHIGTVSQVIHFLFLYNISHNTHINWAETQHKY